jgi:hypothetical protein
MNEPTAFMVEGSHTEAPFLTLAQQEADAVAKERGKPVILLDARGVAVAPADHFPDAGKKIEPEDLIRSCVPGGSSCDPQQVADAIRAYFARGVKNDTAAAIERSRRRAAGPAGEQR